MTPINLVTQILTIFVLVLPLFGKQIDFLESVIFYSLPPLLYFYLYSKKIHLQVPKSITNIELLLIIFFAISTFFSQNIGTSYYYLLRFINSILIFNLVISLQKPNGLAKKIIFFSLIYSIIFILYLLKIIPISDRPTFDNFIKPIWGHSYLADFLVLNFALLTLSQKPKLVYLVFFTIIIGLTNSRSAILSIIPAIFSISQKNKKIIILLVSFLFLFFINFKIINKQTNSKSLLGDRPQYFAQAIQAFADKPLFGWGAGNFYLINSIFRKNISVSSAYSHNFPLNLLCENGIVFTIIFYLLIIKSLIFSYKHNKKVFYLSLCLILHSWLDPTWNSPAILILSLFFITFLYISSLPKEQSKLNINLLLAIVVFVFFISKTLGDILFFYQKYHASLIADPFNLNSRLVLNSQGNYVKSTIALFTNEENIYTNLISSTPLSQSEAYYYTLFKLNPQENFHQYYIDLANFYYQTDQNDKLLSIGKLFLDSNHYILLPDLKTITSLLYKKSIENFFKKPDWSIETLKIATTLFPDEGHFHIDLANMYWSNHQQDLAFKQLNDCQLYDSSKSQCKEYLSEQLKKRSFNPPGSQDFINYFNTTFLTY